MEHPSWVLYIALAGLIMLSAFFSACETAISTVNKLRLKKQAEEGSEQARIALRLASDYDKTLSTILIGNNIVNISASTIGTVIATALWHSSGPLIATIAITLLVLTFGEILPKSYSRQYSDAFMLSVARPLRLVVRLLTPLTALFNAINSRFSKTIAKRNPAGAVPTVTEEELIYMLDSIEEEGVIEEQERDLVQSALEFDETSIREIITPRVNMVAVDAEDDLEEIKQIVITEGYSRIPVFEGSTDNIIGVLLARDLLVALIEGNEIKLRDMLSEPYFVHPTMKLSHLLANLKSRKASLAVVIDEYGGTLGIVTMEDVLEELVGEIWDEDDEIPAGFIELEDNHYEVLGSYSLSDLFDELEYDPKVRELESGFSTVSGWALDLLGYIPEVGEGISHLDMELTVLEMDGQRITKLDILRKADTPASADGKKEK